MELDMIVCGDAVDVMGDVQESSVHLIISDWPYYKVKDEDWDHQWASVEEYLDWIGLVCEHYGRILAANGSLYAFASKKMAWAVEGAIRKHFDVLNSITWRKGEFDTKAEMFPKDTLRSYFPTSEIVIFAEHYRADSAAKGESGYGAKCDELRGFVFEPLRAYLDGERRRAGIDFEQVRQMVGCADGSGLPSHWFTKSQWMLPTFENFLKLCEGFNQQGRCPAPAYEDYHDVPRSQFERDHSEFEYLRAEYEDLRAEYEDLRRPFNVTIKDQYTDVWDFPTVNAYPGKHPCEKPLEMMEHIVRVSSKPGDVVGDFFIGSGSLAEAALRLGRHFMGCDSSEHWVKRANARVALARLEMSQLSFLSGWVAD